MTRIEYLEPLVNYLRTSTILNNHGIAGVPDINGKNIFVFSDWTVFKNAKSWQYGVIIKPLESSIIDGPNLGSRSDCKSHMRHQVMIGVQVKNARNTQQHFQDNVNGGILSYTGAYPQAAKFEELVRETILAYNNAIVTIGSPQYNQLLNPLTLVGCPEPEESDGYLMMPSIYQTTYFY